MIISRPSHRNLIRNQLTLQLLLAFTYKTFSEYYSVRISLRHARCCPGRLYVLPDTSSVGHEPRAALTSNLFVCAAVSKAGACGCTNSGHMASPPSYQSFKRRFPKITRRLYNLREGPYYGLLLVESAYQRFKFKTLLRQYAKLLNRHKPMVRRCHIWTPT